MAYIRQVSEDDATGRLRLVYDAARTRAGSVANIIKVMSCDARTTETSMQFYVSLMKAPGPLSSARREMLATVVSNINDCFY
jgi:alkylhydroperoxidase family enzyme